MNTLRGYILGFFLRFAALLIIGLCLVVLLFDLLAQAGELTQNSDNTLLTLLDYLLLRAPLILTLVMPMATLLASMMTLHKLVKNREMVAIGSAGLSLYALAGVLITGALVLAAVHFIVSETLAPDSKVRLRLWAEQDYAARPPPVPENGERNWIEFGGHILNFKTAAPERDVLYDVLFVRRTPEGALKDYIPAQKAIYEGGRWILQNARPVDLQGRQLTPRGVSKIALEDLALKPEDLGGGGRLFKEMSFWRLARNISAGRDNPALWLWAQRWPNRSA